MDFIRKRDTEAARRSRGDGKAQNNSLPNVPLWGKSFFCIHSRRGTPHLMDGMKWVCAQ